MKKITMFAHAGSKNHGCEAIVRSTIDVLGLEKENVDVFSFRKHEDEAFGLDKVCNIYNQQVNYTGIARILHGVRYVFLKYILKNNDLIMDYYFAPFTKSIRKNDVYFSIGGDNYCYSDWSNFKELNRIATSRGGKTVLWGCSVEPDMLAADKELQKDMQRFSLITARETYSYEALKKVNPNTVLTCDTAFMLKKQEVELPRGFEVKKTIGINVSPLVQRRESGNNMVMANYCHLIEWILENTDEKVALIPHVTWNSNNDGAPLKELYEKYEDSGRMVWCGGDYNCMQLKYIISNCSCFVGARTHSTIAAYSSCVPTLVSGYSIKARGIAKDLFGTEDGYIVSVQAMKQEDELSQAFEKIYTRREEISEYLERTLPVYTAKLADVKECIEKL